MSGCRSKAAQKHVCPLIGPAVHRKEVDAARCAIQNSLVHHHPTGETIAELDRLHVIATRWSREWMAMIDLEARDGHKFGAYRARPDGDVRAGLVVIQEIFGVNGHIRNVADHFAAQGFDALAPALFDRAERGVELGYQPDDIDRGRKIRAQVSTNEALQDVDTAIQFLAQTGRRCRGWLLLGRIIGMGGGYAAAGSILCGFLLWWPSSRIGKRAAAMPGDAALRRDRSIDTNGTGRGCAGEASQFAAIHLPRGAWLQLRRTWVLRCPQRKAGIQPDCGVPKDPYRRQMRDARAPSPKSHKTRYG